MHEQLTRSSLFNLLCCDRKKSQHLHHYFHDYIHHFRRRCHLNVDLETLEEIFHALKDIDEIVVTRPNVLSRLASRRQNFP